MAKQDSTLDTLRTALEAARAEVEAAQAKVDALISEQADIPAAQQAALRDGDGVAYAILGQRERELPAALYFAQAQLLTAQQAAQDAERSLVEAELGPLMAKHQALSAAFAEAAAAQAANGNEIERRRQRIRMLAGQKRHFADELAKLAAEHDYRQRVAAAPVVRALNFAH